MIRRRGWRVAGIVAGVLGFAPGAVAQAQGTAACKVAPGAQCGTLAVPLDHTGAVAGSQKLGFVVLPATGTKTGTLAVLAGGPGQAATPLAPVIAKLLAPVRKSYDVLLLDQRGTGRSDALSCAALDDAATIAEKTLAACGDKLGASRPFFSTHEDAQDLHDVQVALRIPKLSVYAVSSGTGVAGQYARLFPDAVGRLLLDSPVPIEGADSLDRLRALALPRVLRQICAPPGCESFLGADPAAALAKLAAGLASKPLSGTVISPKGKAVKARLTQAALYALTVSTDLSPALRMQLPAAIGSALRGDAAPMLRLAGSASTGGSDEDSEDVNVVRLLATDCIESRLPWDPASAPESRPAALKSYLAAQPAGSFGPFSPALIATEGLVSACLTWPATPKPEGLGPTGPPVPVLVIGGRDDLRTPLEDARRTASQYPQATVLGVPGTGHSVLTSDPTTCTVKALTAFLQDQPVARCTTRVARVPAAPYVPASLGSLPAAPGTRGTPGRTLTAVLATLKDASRQSTLASIGGAGVTRTSISVGGLRGGTLKITRAGITLTGYSAIRGVELTGTIPVKGTRSTFAVSGSAAAAGRVTLTKQALTGTLGGTAVRLTDKDL